MSTTFLFGAGASYGSGPCAPHSPPLGKDLFKAMAAEGGIASRVSPDLAQAFIDDFETGMDRFFRERNVDLTELQRDMARYFAKFSPLEGNAYLKLIRIMGKRSKYVMATTNYDLLIELAASTEGMRTSYRGLPINADNVSVLKIHGSCNFIPEKPPQMDGIGFEVGPQGSVLEWPMRPASPAEVVHFCDTNNSLAPAIAIYSPSKQVLHSPSLVKWQQAQWVESIRSAARLYIIGMRVHEVDEHIWGEIAKANGTVYYVGSQRDVFLDWAKKVGLKHGVVAASTFEEALPHIAATHRRA